jgi:hypothetical protein
MTKERYEYDALMTQLKGYERLVEAVGEWDGWIPTVEQVEAAAKATGCYWNR